MNMQKHSEPERLEAYSFWWSEVRLVLAAIALFLGGIPILVFLWPITASGSLGVLILTIAWVVSGVASAYLLYRWAKAHNQTVFGGKNTADLTAFWISVISGINLGLAGLLRRNIGMSIASGRIIFAIVGLAYLWAAWHLYQRFKAKGNKLF